MLSAKRKSYLLCFFLLAPFVTSSHANEKIPTMKGWSVISVTKPSSNSLAINYGKNGSLKSTSKDSSIIVQFVFKEDADSAPDTSYHQALVSFETCKKGYGDLVFRTLSGEEERSYSYVSGGNSMVTSVGDAICKLTSDKWKKVK